MTERRSSHRGDAARRRSPGALTLALLTASCVTTGCALWPVGSKKEAVAASSPLAPGMNAAGQVVDSAKVEAGRGVKTVGIEGRVGEVTGQPVPGGPLTKLQIGMTVKQVIEAIGAPSDQGSSATYKAWLPWVAGRDQYRFEMVYKGQGRLIFEGAEGGSWAGSRLAWIIHYAGERGYR